MEIEYKCPYCGQSEYSKKSKKSGNFTSWEIVRAHTSKCNKNNGEYYIDKYYGPVHYTNITEESVKDKYRNFTISYSMLVNNFQKKAYI